MVHLFDQSWCATLLYAGCIELCCSGGNGCIMEEAALRCGGEDKLANAVARGDVIKAKNQMGKVLYHFPKDDLPDLIFYFVYILCRSCVCITVVHPA